MSTNLINSQSDKPDLNQLIHDARGPLNRISMQAEMIKLVLENDMPKEKALEAASKIIASCQECSQTLELLSQEANS